MKRFGRLMTFLAALAVTPVFACNNSVERWATTENTQVDINWDKVNEAYKDAGGPEDFERRVNEIYEGDEVISVSVKDADDRSQVVTGFFDKDQNGAVTDGEAIFTITRKPTGEGGQYQTQGVGHYAGYYSPMMSIVSSMAMGAMLSSMFAPTYIPMVYATSPSRVADLRGHRSGYRQANPTRFQKASQTGRSYGGVKRAPSFRGGSRFGIAAGRRRHTLAA